MKLIKTVYRRNLPHIQPIGSTFFITFNLHDAIPVQIIAALQQEKLVKIASLRENRPLNFYEEIVKEHKRHFSKFDAVLDNAIHGGNYLRNREIAQIVMDKITFYDRKYYDLLAVCIMSNHVHLLIDLYVQIEDLPASIDITSNNYKPLSELLKLIKGGSAYEANKILKRKGRFWQVESYDHYVRNEKERDNIIRYIANNPVKANLVNFWQDFSFTYVKDIYRINLP